MNIYSDQIVHYMDDASFPFASNSRQVNQDRIIEIMDRIKEFLNCNQLTVNISKMTIFESMVHQKWSKIKGTPPSINTTDNEGNDKEIKASQHIRLLGINLHQNLSWVAQQETGEKSLLTGLRKQLGQLKFIGR